MSDLNIFLSAIQSAFNTAVKAAVEEATAPLVQRIAVLEQSSSLDKMRLDATAESIAALGQRITTLENNPAQGVDTTQVRDAITQLDAQEWFWSKMSDFILREADGLGLVSESRVEEVVQEAMEEHTSNYDHDSYDNATSTVEDYDFDDFMKKGDGDLEEVVRDTIRNMTFEAR